MSNHIDNILSSEGIRASLEFDYALICGEGSRGGFDETSGRFASYLSSTPLKYLTPASADPRLVTDAWHSFLKKKDGCPKGSAGSSLFDSSVMRRRFSKVSHLEGQGLRLDTSNGPLLIGAPLDGAHDARMWHGALAVLFAQGPEAEAGAQTPIPLRTVDEAQVDGASVPFAHALSAGEVTVAAGDPFTLKIFEGTKYLGSVNLVEALSDAKEYTRAWKLYLDRLLDAAEAAAGALGDAVERGWEALVSDERGAVAAALVSLSEIYAAGQAFVIGDRDHPVAKTKDYVAGRTQLAKIGNALMSASVLQRALALDLEDEAHFEVARNHLLTLFDPFDHLDKSFRLESEMHPYLQMALPASLPKVEAQKPKVLRKMLNEIVLGAAGHGGTIDFGWNAEGSQIIATDAGKPSGILTAFTEIEGAYMSLPYYRGELVKLASMLGDGGKVEFTGGTEGKAPLSISITVPLKKKAHAGRGTSGGEELKESFGDTVDAAGLKSGHEAKTPKTDATLKGAGKKNGRGKSNARRATHSNATGPCTPAAGAAVKPAR